MKAELSVKTQSTKGTGYLSRKFGEIIIFPNGEYSSIGPVPFINVDAFEGSGESYRRRDGNCHIEINDGTEAIFSGSFDELKDIIKKAEIFEHNQWWHLITAAELNDIDREHIAHQILEGYTNGEIYSDEDDDNEYVIVCWPDSQMLMEEEWFSECELLNSDKDLALYGSSAYRVPIHLYNELLKGDQNDKASE